MKTKDVSKLLTKVQKKYPIMVACTVHNNASVSMQASLKWFVRVLTNVNQAFQKKTDKDIDLNILTLTNYPITDYLYETCI